MSLIFSSRSLFFAPSSVSWDEIFSAPPDVCISCRCCWQDDTPAADRLPYTPQRLSAEQIASFKENGKSRTNRWPAHRR